MPLHRAFVFALLVPVSLPWLYSTAPALALSPAAHAEEIEALSQRSQELYREIEREVGRSEGKADTEALARRLAGALDAVDQATREARADGAWRDPAVVGARVAFLAHWIGRSGFTNMVEGCKEVIEARAVGYAREALDLARDPATPAAAWERVARGDRRDLRMAMLAQVLASDPGDVDALAALGRDTYDHRLKLAWFRAAHRARAPEPGARDNGFEAWLLQERVAALLHHGLVEEALDALESAPAPVREVVLAGGQASGRASGLPPVALDLPGPAPEAELRDLRLELAAAYAVRGRPGDGATAARLLAALPPLDPLPEHDGVNPSLEEIHIHTERVQRETVLRLLATTGVLELRPELADDPFELFVDLINVRNPQYRSGTLLWHRVQGRLAEATGYPHLAGHLFDTRCRLEPRSTPVWDLKRMEPYGGAPLAVHEELAWLDGRLLEARAEVVRQAERLADGREWVRSEAVCAEPTGTGPLGLGGRRDGQRRFPTPAERLKTLRLAHAARSGETPLPRDLVELLADGDGDGLSDREERLLTLDPESADSDGDGIDDGHDLLIAPPAGAADPDAEAAVGAALTVIFHRGASSELRPTDQPSDAPVPSWRTHFVAGPGTPVGRLEAKDRVVVLDRDSLGTKPAVEITLLTSDRNRSRAILLWRERPGHPDGRGAYGRFLLERVGDTGAWRPVHEVHHHGGCVTAYIAHR